jgi:voltage-dependent potassium channel beta subunit
MEYRFLGKTGLKVSALSFGSWVTFSEQVDKKVASNCMKTAYDFGVNFFDNAEGYAAGKSESMMGEIIKDFGWKRSDLVLSTKIFWGGRGPNDRGLSFKHIIEGTNASLKRMQTEYVDLIFCHRPDFYTPIEETVRAMNVLINQGKAFYWGTSEWTAVQLMEAYEIARREHLIPPVMEQPQYNMFVRDKVEKEFADLYTKIGLGTTIWSPLASGILTGKYNNGIPKNSRLSLNGYEWLKERFESENGKHQIKKVIELEKIAKEMNCSISEMAIAWCLLNKNVSTVITGASKPEQVKTNMNSLNIVELLDNEILEKIETILDNKPEHDFDWRNN